MKVYDYINHIDKRFRLRSTRVHRQHSPLSLLCITMILRVCRNFFEITMFPNRYMVVGVRTKREKIVSHQLGVSTGYGDAHQ